VDSQSTTEAERLVEEGNSLKDAGDVAGAERAYRGAIVASPAWSVPYYDLGLLCKYAGRWQESLTFNAQAAERDPDDEAAWWNLGIAATAVPNWPEARRAWTACGMTPPAGDGPPDFNFGLIPVRLDPDDRGEVVWAHRIDPARAAVRNVPLPVSAHNYGEVLLTDGAPDGYRTVKGKEYPVLNMLAVLERSPLRKYVIELATADSASIELLEDVAQSSGGAAENWATSTNILCAQCSRGTPHELHRQGTPAHPHCGLAARDDAHAESIIHEWLEQSPRADLVRWFDAEADLP
jgi:hypothetical protein